jgi:hypothetical protein
VSGVSSEGSFACVPSDASSRKTGVSTSLWVGGFVEGEMSIYPGEVVVISGINV